MRPKCQIRVRKGDKFRLAINPYYGKDVKRFGRAPQIPVTQSYTFLERLPVMPEKGMVGCSVQWVHKGNEEVEMNLDIFLQPDKKGHDPIKWEYRIPLYFDCGTRCLMPGKRSTPVEEVVPGLG